jgi:hypothetical protein
MNHNLRPQHSPGGRRAPQARRRRVLRRSHLDADLAKLASATAAMASTVRSRERSDAGYPEQRADDDTTPHAEADRDDRLPEWDDDDHAVSLNEVSRFDELTGFGASQGSPDEQEPAGIHDERRTPANDPGRRCHSGGDKEQRRPIVALWRTKNDDAILFQVQGRTDCRHRRGGSARRRGTVKTRPRAALSRFTVALREDMQ